MAIENGRAPNFKSLLDRGVVSWNAVAGGLLDSTTQQATSSGPGWCTILTGVWTNHHRIVDNGDSMNLYAQQFSSAYPSFLKRIKDAQPDARVATFVSWPEIDRYLLEPVAASIAHRRFIAPNDHDYSGCDRALTDECVAHLKSADPDFIFLYYGNLDEIGHASGHSPDNPNYRKELETIDALFGRVLAAMRARPGFADEQWLVILTADHGGVMQKNQGGHGGQSAEERTIPMIVSGLSPFPIESRDTPGQPAVASTVLQFLGVTVDPAWGIGSTVPLGASFGLPPYVRAEPQQGRIALRWTLPEKKFDGIEIYRNGIKQTALPSSATQYADPIRVPASRATYSYEIRFLGSGETPRQCFARYLPTAPATLPLLSDGLVTHLAFEGDIKDASGRNNHSIATGEPRFAAGKIGQSVVLNNTASLSLGKSDDLNFGAETDFTVSFWVKFNQPWRADPIFIGNKSWESGGNVGWCIAGGDGKPIWQWNFRGKTAGRRDFDPSGPATNDGQWHLITITHDRRGAAVFYQDSKEIGEVDIAGCGSLDSGLPIQLGCDGTGKYPLNVDAQFDDLRVWRRALWPGEVQKLFLGR